MMKNIKCLILLILNSVIFCDSNENKENTGLLSQAKMYLDILQVYIFGMFEKMEVYTIKLHNFIKDDMSVSYPLDIVFFISLGIIIYWLKSKISFGSGYVYNTPDYPDTSYLMKNVKYRCNK
jgi:hypothetical protein